jgi:hypothetical protein
LFALPIEVLFIGAMATHDSATRMWISFRPIVVHELHSLLVVEFLDLFPGHFLVIHGASPKILAEVIAYNL